MRRHIAGQDKLVACTLYRRADEGHECVRAPAVEKRETMRSFAMALRAASASARTVSKKASCGLSVRNFGVANKLAGKSDAELAQAVQGWTREWTPGPLTPAELTQFWEDGFVVKEGILAGEQCIENAIESVNGMVDTIAQRLKQAGKIQDAGEGLGFNSRLVRIEEQFEHAGVLLHKHGVLPQGVIDVWTNERLLGVAQQVLGSEIAGHPVWNLRCKTPEQLSQGQATVPWHQDISYLEDSCWSTLQLTAWVPLVDATAENGCMQVIRGGHRTGRAATHTCCVGGTWYTEVTPEEMTDTLGVDMEADIVTCEVPKGSVLFLNNLVPHQSTANTSSNIRWSLDLRWQRPDEPDGFRDIKPCILMRTASDPDYRPDFSEWGAQNRTNMQMDELRDDVKQAVAEAHAKEFGDVPDSDFDTTIAGPWMHRWELVHHNRHTAVLGKDDEMVGWHA